MASFLRRTTNFSEVLESLDPKVASKSELDELSYIVGKNYENLETYEIEDFSLEQDSGEEHSPEDYSSRITFPYFKVISDGVSYSSETMGLGELSIFILFWTLNRISENSILLIEEPETYISPSAQKKFMDFMAKMSDIKHIWVILTTHSPSVVENIHLDKINLLTRNDAGVTVIDTPSRFQLDEVLDNSHSYGGILLVEDIVAQIFLASLLSRLASDIHKGFEILIAEDEGALSKLKNSFPGKSAWFKIAAVYDGDQREKQNDGNIPHGFLPGTLPPEELLRTAAINNLQRLSSTLNRSVDDLRVVLNVLQGRDCHDWLEELGIRLFVDKRNLIDILVGICLDTNDAAKSDAVTLIEMLRATFKLIP